jgi:hypothetical protein
MDYRSIHPQFTATFAYFDSVPDAIREGLWNYMAYGLPPGSFLEAVLKNNFQTAILRADSSWSGRSFKDLAKWIDGNMPSYMRGDEKSMTAWIKKTDEERRDIMIELKLRPNEFDILRGVAVT